MKKSDLKTGMWVETRNGQEWIVLLGSNDGDVVVYQEGNGGFNYLDSYEEDLLMNDLPEFDIVRVYQPSPMCYLSDPTEDENCIFDRSTISNAINVNINAKIENLEEIKKQIEDLEESLKNLKIKLQF